MKQHETSFSKSGFKKCSAFSSIRESSKYAWEFQKLIYPLRPCWTPGSVILFPNTHRGATFKVKAAKMEREETRHVFIGHTQANLKGWKHRPHWLFSWKLWFHTILGLENMLQFGNRTHLKSVSFLFSTVTTCVNWLTELRSNTGHDLSLLLNNLSLCSHVW